MGKRYVIEEKKDKSGVVMLILSLIFILGGCGVFLYPSISNYFAEKNQTDAIDRYEELVVQIDEDALKREFEKAQAYNENLSGDPVHDPFVAGSGYALPENYTEVLNITNDGIMSYINIPKIKVNLPIYHGTGEDALTKGVGHVESTSLPIGGESTHCVLTGHTGLPSAELFTRLDELKVKDIFYIHTLNEVLTYKVYQIKVILPTEIEELQITMGEDLITLVTCTPYGVNSHRLLVKAKRVEYEEYKPDEAEETGEEPKTHRRNYYLEGVQIGGTIFVVILIFIIILVIIKKRRKKKHEQKDN